MIKSRQIWKKNILKQMLNNSICKYMVRIAEDRGIFGYGIKIVKL